MAEIETGARAARHTHPGIDSVYLMEGGGPAIPPRPDQRAMP